MMARSWRDYTTAEPADKRDNRDVRTDPGLETGAFVPNVPNVHALPSAVHDGLMVLGEAAAPRLRRPELWPQVIADAQRLASEGWASQGLSLGWGELDLFGAVPDANGDPAADGLAVRLAGRRVLAICASFATVAEANGGRVFLYRGNNAGARLLWELGRGR